FGGKTSIFSHSVYLFLREFSLQDSRGGSSLYAILATASLTMVSLPVNPRATISRHIRLAL
ncbi:hypothetical protein OSK75_23390, partial [Escherichia coli]|nr:hypothetical protein [Escherichia coli]